jgi:hypothetical protein
VRRAGAFGGREAPRAPKTTDAPESARGCAVAHGADGAPPCARAPRSLRLRAPPQGARAKSTNRSETGNKGLVKSGANIAKVVVRMRNRGIEAYRPEVFGHTIIVERSISASVRRAARAAPPGRPARSNMVRVLGNGALSRHGRAAPAAARVASRDAPRARARAAALHHAARTRGAHAYRPRPSPAHHDRRARRR